MAIILYDIHVELDPKALLAANDPTRVMREASRHAAEEHARLYNLTIIGDGPTDIMIGDAFNPVTARTIVAVATRWRAEGEEPAELIIERWKANQ